MLINGQTLSSGRKTSVGEHALENFYGQGWPSGTTNLVDPAAVAPVAVVHPLQLDAVPLLAAVHRRLLVLQVPAAAARSPELTFSAQKATLVKPINACRQLG